MIVNVKQAIDCTIRCMKAKLSCMLGGDPGIGKSAIVKEISKQFKLELIDIRLSTYDPVDLSGFPMVVGDVAQYVPMNTFPLEGKTEIPAGKVGWLIFFDEFNSASLAVQAAAYKTVLDRQVGQHNLHPKTAIVCAGNLSTSGAIVNRMSTAMQSRLIHLELEVFPEEWLDWGNKANIDHRILAYIHGVPENLHKFDPQHDDKTFACPRTWHFLSDLIKNVPTPQLRELHPLLAGTVGMGASNEFINFTEVYSHMPTYPNIVAKPMEVTLSNEPAMMFALAHMIAAFLKKADVPQVMLFLDRLPIEFQTITLQNAAQKNPDILKEKTINRWYTQKGVELF